MREPDFHIEWIDGGSESDWMKKLKFKVGDRVRPRVEWRGDRNRVPSGRVRAIEPWGDEGALYVGKERRAFASYVFEHAAHGRRR